MSDPAEEPTQSEGSEPITIRVRDQVSDNVEREHKRVAKTTSVIENRDYWYVLAPCTPSSSTHLLLCDFFFFADGRRDLFQDQKDDQNVQGL